MLFSSLGHMLLRADLQFDVMIILSTMTTSLFHHSEFWSSCHVIVLRESSTTYFLSMSWLLQGKNSPKPTKRPKMDSKVFVMLESDQSVVLCWELLVVHVLVFDIFYAFIVPALSWGDIVMLRILKYYTHSMIWFKVYLVLF